MSFKKYLTSLLLLICCLTVSGSTDPKPHIIMVLIDDLGWANVNWHRDIKDEEVQTPVLDELVATGIELNRAYVIPLISCSLFLSFSLR